MNVEFALKVPVKPACYDSKPACLCKLCHMYDVRMSTRMPIAKPVPCRSVAKSTSGLASIGGSCVLCLLLILLSSLGLLALLLVAR